MAEAWNSVAPLISKRGRWPGGTCLWCLTGWHTHPCSHPFQLCVIHWASYVASLSRFPSLQNGHSDPRSQCGWRKRQHEVSGAVLTHRRCSTEESWFLPYPQRCFSKAYHSLTRSCHIYEASILCAGFHCRHRGTIANTTDRFSTFIELMICWEEAVDGACEFPCMQCAQVCTCGQRRDPWRTRARTSTSWLLELFLSPEERGVRVRRGRDRVQERLYGTEGNAPWGLGDQSSPEEHPHMLCLSPRDTWGLRWLLEGRSCFRAMFG